MRLERGGPIALGVILTTILIDFMGYLLLVPVLPEHLSSLGARETSDQGLIVGLYMFALVVALPIWGWIADRVGRRPVLVVCLLGSALAFVLMASADGLGLFYLARVLQGVFGASVGTAQAYMSDLTREEDRARGFGLIGAAGSLGLLSGPALGGALYGIDPGLTFQAPAVLALAAAGAAALFLPESRSPNPERASLAGLLRSVVPAPLWVVLGVHNPRVLIFLYLYFHIFVAFGAVEAMFPNFATATFGWDPTAVGWFLSYVALVAAITQGGLIGRLVRLSGERALVSCGIAIAAASMVFLATSRSVWLLTLAASGLAFGFGAVVPAFTSLFSRACQDDDTGAYHAHSHAMLNFGRGMGAYLGGIAAGALGASAPLLLGGVALVLALGIFVVALPLLWVPAEPRRRAESPSGSGLGGCVAAGPHDDPRKQPARAP